MMRKRIIISIIVVILLAVGIYQIFFKKEKPTFTLAEVIRGNVVQEVSETGQVKKGEEINLSFKNSGEIEEIYVETGDKVESNQVLAKLDTSQFEIQLAEAKAGLAVIEAGKRDAQISLDSARQKLEDTIATANEKLEKAYKDALSALDDSYLKIYNAFNFIDLLKRTSFYRGDWESIAISDNKIEIEKALNLAKFYIDQTKSNSKEEDIDLAIIKVKEALLKTKEQLEKARNTTETGTYRDIISSTDKNTLDTHKLNINTAYSNVVSAQANVSLIKTTNAAEINTAQSQVSALENQLREGKESLYQAQINQAKAQVQLLENQIEEAILRSPISGQITKVIKRIGETVQPMMKDVVISLIPEEPFQIEVDIPEVEIGKIDLGDPSKITLDAFPEEEFSGKVIEIEPAETIISGVVYYKIKISLDTENTKIKPGITANVTIIIDFKENVLILPQRAVLEKNGKKFVRVPEDSTFKEIEVQTGLKGSGGEIEIISGLKEGDKVITFIKSD